MVDVACAREDGLVFYRKRRKKSGKLCRLKGCIIDKEFAGSANLQLCTIRGALLSVR